MFWLSPDRFDDLTRALGATTSRRQALRLLVGGLAASLLAVVRDGVTSPAAASGDPCEYFNDCAAKQLSWHEQGYDDCANRASLDPGFDVKACEKNVDNSTGRLIDSCLNNCGPCVVCTRTPPTCRPRCKRCEDCVTSRGEFVRCKPSSAPKECQRTTGPYCCGSTASCCPSKPSGCCYPTIRGEPTTCCPGSGIGPGVCCGPASTCCRPVDKNGAWCCGPQEDRRLNCGSKFFTCTR
jgi:hypothetical protein